MAQVEVDALTAKLRALIPAQKVERSLCSVARPKLRNTHGQTKPNQTTKCCGAPVGAGERNRKKCVKAMFESNV